MARDSRRRLIAVIVLTLVLGVAGAVAGWEVTEPLYRSTGLVSIAVSVPTPRDPEGKSVMPRLDEFVKTQAAFLGSRRVVLRAMASDDWQRSGSDIDLAAFEDRLEIAHEGKRLHIEVKFSDTDPATAAAGVKAVVQAYEELSADLRGGSARRSLEHLRMREYSLRQDAQQLDREVQRIAARFGGAEGLGIRLEALHRELAGLETSRRELGRQIRLLEGERESVSRRPLTLEEWAMRDGNMKELLAERQAIEARIEGLRQTHGAKNPQLVLARRELEQLTHRALRLAAMLDDASEKGGGELRRLTERRSILESDIEVVRKEALEVGRASSDLRRLIAERERLEAGLAQVREAVERVEARQHGEGRVAVFGEGDVPVTPYRDRRIPMAAGLGAAGAGLGLLLALLLDFVGRRRRQRALLRPAA